MTGGNSSRSFTARGAEQARLLTDPVSKGFFKPFPARERTASQATLELGCKLSTLLYRLKLSLNTSLLVVSRVEARTGRALKHYRSLHDAYFIPFGLTPHAELGERLEAQVAPFTHQLVRALAKAQRQNAREGQLLFRGAEGTVWTGLAAANPADGADTATDPTQVVALFSDVVVHLTQTEAEALGETLVAIRDAHAKPATSRAKRYTL